MENYSLIDYISNEMNLDSEILDYLRYELEKHIYYYGEQFKYPKEKKHQVYDNNISIKKLVLSKVKAKVKEVLSIGREVSPGITSELEVSMPSNELLDSKVIVSSAYFSTNEELEKLGYDIYSPVWLDSNGEFSKELIEKCELVKNWLSEKDFSSLLSDTFFNYIRELKAALVDYYSNDNIKAIVLSQDMAFFERLSIDIFKQLKKPSFIFLHGLPATYSPIDDNRTDYLIVWGEQIKRLYTSAGIEEKKIFISGHPYYKSFSNRNLRFELDNILVITKSMNGAQQNNEVILSDRGNLILYLYSIQNVLTKLGVKSVRFRPHPSEELSWYKKYLDNNFYNFDDMDLAESLEKSSLVIGPTSTLFIESIYYGVNYIVYEPSKDNIDLINYTLVPPFDGSDSRVPVAKTEEMLLSFITNKIFIDSAVIKDYIKMPFSLEFINDLL